MLVLGRPYSRPAKLLGQRVQAGRILRGPIFASLPVLLGRLLANLLLMAVAMEDKCNQELRIEHSKAVLKILAQLCGAVPFPWPANLRTRRPLDLSRAPLGPKIEAGTQRAQGQAGRAREPKIGLARFGCSLI